MSEIEIPASTSAAATGSADASETPSGGGFAVPPTIPTYPKVSPEYAELTRRIGRGRSFPLPALHSDAELILRLSTNTSVSWRDTMGLEGPFGMIDFAQGARMLRALTGFDLEGERAADEARWTWIQGAAVGRLAGTPFASASKISKGVITSWQNQAILCIELRSPGHVLAGDIRASTTTWMNLLDANESAPNLLPDSLFLDAPIDVPVRVARHALPAGMLAGMRRGDIIMPAEPLFDCEGRGRITIGKKCMRVRFDAPNTVEVLAMEKMMENDNEQDYLDDDAEHDDFDPDEALDSAASDDDFLPAAEGGTAQIADNASMDAVPLTITFDVGRIRLLMGDARAIAVGTVLTVADGAPGAVTVRAAGRSLGRGEIVDVGGKLGIRITAWGKPC